MFSFPFRLRFISVSLPLRLLFVSFPYSLSSPIYWKEERECELKEGKEIEAGREEDRYSEDRSEAQQAARRRKTGEEEREEESAAALGVGAESAVAAEAPAIGRGPGASAAGAGPGPGQLGTVVALAVCLRKGWKLPLRAGFGLAA